MNKKERQTKLVSWITDEDWYNLGKFDAWALRAKQPPEEDLQAKSVYLLGYNDGLEELRPIEKVILPNLCCQIN